MLDKNVGQEDNRAHGSLLIVTLQLSYYIAAQLLQCRSIITMQLNYYNGAQICFQRLRMEMEEITAQQYLHEKTMKVKHL